MDFILVQYQISAPVQGIALAQNKKSIHDFRSRLEYDTGVPGYGIFSRDFGMARKAGGRRKATGWGERLFLLARRFWLAPIAVTVLLWAGAWLWLGGGESSLGQALVNLSAKKGFVVSSVMIEGRAYADPASLRDAISVQRGDPIFGFRLADLREKIEAISWVRTARVERRLPDILYIQIEERKPVALWQKDGTLALVDRDGVVLSHQGLEQFSSLPMVSGANAQIHAKDLADMVEAEPEIARRLEVAQWVGDRRWTLHMKGGMIVLLPEEDPEPALRQIVQAQEREGIFDRGLVAEIDARIPGKMGIHARRLSQDAVAASASSASAASSVSPTTSSAASSAAVEPAAGPSEKKKIP